jgi:SAM-dependent methyltransferase
MNIDHYAGAGRRWATGATLVYGPIATELVSLCPHPLEGHTVLDAGAGTGAASTAVADRGADPIAVDYSHDMLTWHSTARPPAAVADVCALPFADRAFDDTVAAFVLNHLLGPADGFAELVRVTRPGGAVLACVYSNGSHSEARDRIDAVAQAEGWEVPHWYVEIKASATPLLGTASNMTSAARAAGLVDVDVREGLIDVGVTEPEQLVDYRFGQAHFAAWLDEIGDARGEEVRRRAADAVRPIMRPYRPIVVFLAALVPDVHSSEAERPDDSGSWPISAS